MKLSIIVPIYNVEPYLPRCVDSILSQTFRDFEVILVDDGSSDHCGGICDEYAAADSRVRVIHKTNGGMSSARNAGLDIAQGEYIGFVDSDDFIHPQMYEVLCGYAQREDADIAQISPMLFDDGTEPDIQPVDTENLAVTIFSHQQLLEGYYINRKKVECTVWSKIYRRDIFKEIRFPVGWYYEDSAIELATYDAAKNLVAIPLRLYYYRQRNGSIMHSKLTPKWFYGSVIYGENVRFFRKRGLTKQADVALDRYATRFCRDKFAVYIRYPQYKQDFKAINRDFMKEFPNIIKSPGMRKKKKLMLLCSYISPRLAHRICKKSFPGCLYLFMR